MATETAASVETWVTAEEACPTADVTDVAGLDGATAGPELAGAAAGLLAADPAGTDTAPVSTEDTAGTSWDVADCTGPVTAVTTGVTGREGNVLACADLEDSSRTATIPAATIAPCIARRAMRRDTGCGMSSSCLAGMTPDVD